MKKLFFFSVLLAGFSTVQAQKFSADKGHIKFYSSATIEDIAADNKMASSTFNEETGDVFFSVPINEFHFEKSLMEKHFNEKYMESKKFPNATFQGKISDFQKPLSTPQKATAKGKMTIHGVSKEIAIVGTIESKKENEIVMKAKFIVRFEDYQVTIPKLLWKSVAEQVEVTIEFMYKKS